MACQQRVYCLSPASQPFLLSTLSAQGAVNDLHATSTTKPFHETIKMCCCLSWPFKDIQYEAAPKYKNTTTGYRYQWNGQSWDLQQIQVPTVSSRRRSFCRFTNMVVPRRAKTGQTEIAPSSASSEAGQRWLLFANPNRQTQTQSLMSGCPDTQTCPFPCTSTWFRSIRQTTKHSFYGGQGRPPTR